MNQKVDGAEDFFSEYANVAALLGLDGDEPSDLFKELVRKRSGKKFQGWQSMGIQPSLITRFLFLHLKENPAEIQESLSMLPTLIHKLRSAYSNVVSRSQ